SRSLTATHDIDSLSYTTLFRSQGGWINGGFFVFEPAVLPLIAGDDESLEQSLLMKLTSMRQLAVYQHHGFWQCMDTPREMDLLKDRKSTRLNSSHQIISYAVFC